MDSEYMAWLYLQGYTGSDNSNQYPVGEGDIDDSSTWALVPLTEAWQGDAIQED